MTKRSPGETKPPVPRRTGPRQEALNAPPARTDAVPPNAATEQLGRARGEWRRALALSLLSVAAMTTVSAPTSWWPLAFLCLTPWAFAAATTQNSPLFHWISFLCGAAYFMIDLRWMYPVTGLGYAALAFYLAVYWPLAGWAVRSGCRRAAPLCLTLPIAWVACEFLRATVITGFPWLFLSHALYQQLPLIQISDITGAYGVSFLAAMANGVVADLLLRRALRVRPASFALGRPATRSKLALSVAFTALAFAGAIAYGYYQIGRSDFAPGPRIAVIQEDFPLRSEPPYGEHHFVVMARYMNLAARAITREKPDILALPETMWSAFQNVGFLAEEHRAVPGLSAGTSTYGNISHRATGALARGDYAAVNREITTLERLLNSSQDRDRNPARLARLPDTAGPPVTVVLGALAVDVFPESIYPRLKKYNSALVYDADGNQRRERYDKVHLVPFGEEVPFRYGRLHWLYVWLNSLSPFSDNGKTEYSLSPGEAFTVFRSPAWAVSAAESSTRPAVPSTLARATEPSGDATAVSPLGTFGTPICYEDAMPEIIRHFVWDGAKRRVDFLINISNDGWFLHSAELPQHLAICAFRAVENRVGIARAVNTGISGFIDPNGRLYSLVNENGRTVGDGRGIVGYACDRVLIDHRASLHGRFGDWFAIGCGVLFVGGLIDSVIRRVRSHRLSASKES